MGKPKVMMTMKIEKGNRTLIIGRELRGFVTEYHYFVHDSMNYNVKSPLPLHKEDALKMIEEML